MRTPRAAAIARILFAVLFGASMVIIRLSIPSDQEGGAAWLESRIGSLTVAASLMPLTGRGFEMIYEDADQRVELHLYP